MSLLENTVTDYQRQAGVEVMESPAQHSLKDEMTLLIEKVVQQKNAMPDHVKQEKQKNAETLITILNQVIEEKALGDAVSIRSNEANELVVDGLSEQHLHSFLIKAEELGKNIKYTRSLKVEITD